MVGAESLGIQLVADGDDLVDEIFASVSHIFFLQIFNQPDSGQWATVCPPGIGCDPPRLSCG